MDSITKGQRNLLLFILGIIFSVAQSGQSVFLAVFATSPLNEKKILYLLLSIGATDLIMWGVNWCISYFTMFSEIKTRSSILEYYFSKIELNIFALHYGC